MLFLSSWLLYPNPLKGSTAKCHHQMPYLPLFIKPHMCLYCLLTSLKLISAVWSVCLSDGLSVWLNECRKEFYVYLWVCLSSVSHLEFFSHSMSHFLYGKIKRGHTIAYFPNNSNQFYHYSGCLQYATVKLTSWWFPGCGNVVTIFECVLPNA